MTAGMLCLLAADLAGLRGLGPVAATGVLIALAAMLPALPGMLACAGRWLLAAVAAHPRPGQRTRCHRTSSLGHRR
nr:MMPL family transporter [Actinomadura violacea]